MSKIRISVDDACASDVRLAELCIKYGVSCTFYIPVEWHSLAYSQGYQPLEYIDALALSQTFEIGSHSITHRLLTRIPEDEALYEISMSKAILEQLFYQKINKFAPPRGYTNKRLTEKTLEVYDEQRLTVGEGLVHIHPKSGVNNNVHWRDRVREAKVIELWCHSYELDKFELWDELENYLDSLS